MTRRTMFRLVTGGIGAGLLGLALFLLLGCLFLLVGDLPRDEWGYVGGRDTVSSFGTGRWVVNKTGSRATGDRRLDVYDRKEIKVVVPAVTDWREVGNRVFVLGEDGRYAVLDIGTGEVVRYERVEDAPADDRGMLGGLRAR